MNIIGQRTGSVLLIGFFLLMVPSRAQEDSFKKNFKHFPAIAPGIDFYAANRQDVAPFEKAVVEAHQKLTSFLASDLAKGAIVICTSLEQKDAVSEQRILKLGHRWVLIELTPEAASQQMIARLKAQMGAQLPPGMLERIQNQSPEMKAAADARLVASVVQRMAYALITTTTAPEREFRLSRVDDVGRSPLADWVDLGLTSHVATAAAPNLRFLQDHMEEAFPLEDVLGMARPFVPPSIGGGMSMGPMIIRGPAGGGPTGGSGPMPAPTPGAPPPSGGAGANREVFRGGPGGSLPKDVQDRLLFDTQSVALFSFLIQKVGAEKVKQLIQSNRDGKDTREILLQPEFLGPDLDKAEQEWQSWVKAQKTEPAGMRMIQTRPGAAPPKPQ